MKYIIYIALFFVGNAMAHPHEEMGPVVVECPPPLIMSCQINARIDSRGNPVCTIKTGPEPAEWVKIEDVR